MQEKSKLTKKQSEVLEYIKKSQRVKGYPPSIREICQNVNLSSTSSVQHHLNNLAKKGYIHRDPLKPRALEILDEPYDIVSVNNEIVNIPIIGKVTAGSPILAVENFEGTYPIPVEFTHNSDCFILTIQGTSMINAGILDGDYVIVKKQNVAVNGNIVVALIEDEATVKTFYKEQDRFRLQPENPDMDPIYTNDLQILGKVIGVIRHL